MDIINQTSTPQKFPWKIINLKFKKFNFKNIFHNFNKFFITLQSHFRRYFAIYIPFSQWLLRNFKEMKSISWQCKFFSWTWTTFFVVSIMKIFFIYFIFSQTKVKFSMSFFGRLCIYEKWWIFLTRSCSLSLSGCNFLMSVYEIYLFFNTFISIFLNNSKIWAGFSWKKFCAVFQMNFFIFIFFCYTILTQSGWIFHVCIFINSSRKIKKKV